MKFCVKCGSELVSKDIDGNDRYACSNPGCNYIYWNNPIPVVAALVEYNHNYIIARNKSWPRGVFSVITGFLEQDESPEEAVIREVSEELGLDGTIKKHIGNYIFKEKNQVILCYEVNTTGSIKTNYELAEIKQLSPVDLSKYNFSPLYITKKIIRDWAKKSEHLKVNPYEE